MSSVKSYNKMMMSECVFSRLDGYSHVLIHEPDAIVLQDNLCEFCEKPYDYIGAPWFTGFGKATQNSTLIGVGNFGLSLHNLTTVQRILSSPTRWYPYSAIGRDFLAFFLLDFKRAARGKKACGEAGLLRGAYKLFYRNCDRFWTDLVPAVDPAYLVAPIEEALCFSWETLPRKCMELNGGKIPFGLHKWYKYDLDFVLDLLSRAGVDASSVVS